jgi:anti-anti-sigma factor
MAVAEFPVPVPLTGRPDGGVPATVEYLEQATIVWLRGELDLSTARDESLAMTRAIAAGVAVVVDLGEVDFIGASTIGLISRSVAVAAVQEHSLIVRNPTPFATRLLEICGLCETVVCAHEAPRAMTASGGP